MASNKEIVVPKDLLEKHINLLPDHIKKRRKNQRRSLILLMCIGLIAIGISAYTVRIVNVTNELKSNTEAASYRISLLKEEQAQQAIVKVLEEKIIEKETFLTTLKERNESIVMILSMLDISLPKGVLYNSVTASNEAEITISGAGENYEQLADFVHNLKATNHFDKVFLADASKVVYRYGEGGLSVTYYTYTITCSIGGETDEI